MSSRDESSRYDAVVVGARCAGAATAMLLARAGLRVLAVDRARRGSDTLSTHALMRGGVLQLSRWGLLDRIVAGGTPPVRRTAFRYGADVLDIAMRPRDGIDALYAPRRTLLDAVLADAAEEAGAHLRFGTTVTGLRRDSAGRVTGVDLRDGRGATSAVSAGLTVGADGARSVVARLAGARVLHRGPAGGAVLYGYWPGIPDRGYRWCFAPGGSAGVIPTGDGLSCVWVGGPPGCLPGGPERDRWFTDRLGALAPEVAAPPASRHGPLRGFPGAPGVLRAAAGPGWALVGDAGLFKDPVTAHGITDALRDAELLADATVAGLGGVVPMPAAMNGYQRRRDVLARPLLAVTEEIAGYGWDLERLRALHLDLNTVMRDEVTALLERDVAVPRAA